MNVEYEQQIAIDIYELQAKNGCIDAQNLLGDAYYKGAGVDKDYEKAVYWLTKAAEQGHMLAQYDLGRTYADDDDMELAVYWYTQSAQQGHYDAQYRLGQCYDQGLGVERNVRHALYWYIQSMHKIRASDVTKWLDNKAKTGTAEDQYDSQKKKIRNQLLPIRKK